MLGWVHSAKERGCGCRKAELSPKEVVWHLSRITVRAWVGLQCQIKRREGVGLGRRNYKPLVRGVTFG